MLASFYKPNILEAGCDEAGRGCLAGPVVAAAVILPQNWSHPLINDSKKLTALQRAKLKPIIEQEAISFAVHYIDHKEIDQINILRASFKAMHGALDALVQRPEHILVDGNRFVPYQDIDFTCIVKGDGKYMSIAAASVLAKTYRDEYMEQLHLQYPMYGWDSNKGYPTVKHRQGIVMHGPSPYHRKSFQLTPPPVQGTFF